MFNSLEFIIIDDRFLEQLIPIRVTLNELNSGHEVPIEDEIELLKFLRKILLPLKALTDKFSEEKNVSCSNIIYLLSWAMSSLRSIKNKANNQLERKIIDDIFSLFDSNGLSSPSSIKNYAIAAYIDPRYKSFAFSSDGRVNDPKYLTAKGWVKTEAYKLISSDSQLDSSFDEISFSENDDLFNELEIRKSRVTDGRLANDSNVINETSGYASEKAIGINSDPLDYWKKRQFSWPTLALIAKKYLGLLSSPVPCERLFSKIGQIITDRRSRLDPKRVNKIVFVKCNSFLRK